MIVSPEDGWQGTAAPRGSAVNDKCQVDQEEDVAKKENYESAGMVKRDLGVVYVSCDPLICAQFKRSTSSIIQINE